jgi:hypothetical protein
VSGASASWELQKALVAFLAADAGVQAVLGTSPCRIFDDVPPDAQTPYVLAGDEEEDTRAGEDIPGSGHMFALTVCSADVGFRSCKEIAQILRDLLDGNSLDVPGFSAGTITWHRTSHRRNPDQATLRQSTLVFEIELRPTSS